MGKKILCSLLVITMVLSGIDFNALAIEMQDKAEVMKVEGVQTDLGENTGAEEQEFIPDEIDSEQEDENGDLDNENSGQEGDRDSEEDFGKEDESVNSEEENSEQEDTDLKKEDSNADEMENDSEDIESAEEKKSNSEVEEEKDDEQNVNVQGVSENQENELASYGLENHKNAEQFAGGSGTKEDPYLISNIEELNLFAMKAGFYNGRLLYYKLVTDIRLNESIENPVNSWTPIDTLKGYFDGNGHKIENLYICVDKVETDFCIDVGLFSNVEDYGNISNLTIENTLVEIDAKEVIFDDFFSYSVFNVGAIAGRTYTKATVENCTICGKTIFTNLNPTEELRAGSVGGMIGDNGGTISYCDIQGNLQFCPLEIESRNISAGGIVGSTSGTVEYCSNYGQIINEGGDVAGIVDECSNGNGIAIQHCRNEKGASVTSLTGNAAGIMVESTWYGSVTISNCHNLGNVSAAKNQRASGIVDTFCGGIISECSNEGMVENAQKIAGIVGNIERSGSASIIGCKNTADISAGVVSGIVGKIEISSNNELYTVNVTECVNYGELTGSLIGGIVEEIDSRRCHVQIVDCHNEGKLIGTAAAAGIVRGINEGISDQYQYSSTLIQKCYNQGEIYVDGGASFKDSGGIAGNANYVIIEQCYNVGKLLSDDSIGGIAGGLGFYDEEVDLHQIRECFNLGEIISKDTAGGIVADITKGKVSDCYNMGTVLLVEAEKTSLDTRAGGIAGILAVYAGTGAGTGIIENSFNCGKIASESSKGKIGGIAGYVSPSYENTSAIMRNCYNVGKVEAVESAKQASGAIIGLTYDENQLQANGLFYLDDGLSAVGAWDNGGWEIPVLSSTTACTEDQMKQISTYEGWDFDNIWKRGNHKYQFPILRGVGERYLTYNYAGIGQDTAFGEYILQAVDKDSGIGISNAVFSYQDQTVTADQNGMIRILSANPALGKVSVIQNNYHDQSEEVTLRYGEVNTIQMERKKEIKISKVSMNASPHIKGGETTINGDTSNALDIQNFPIKIDLNFKTNEEKEEGESGGGFANDVPVKVTWETGENGEKKSRVKISIGSETKNTVYDDYSYAKSMLEKWKNLQSEEILKDMGKMDIRKVSGKFGAESIKAYVLGYITIDFSGGTPRLLESGAVVGIEGEGTVTYRPAWAGTVAYGQFKLNLKGEGSINVTFDEMLGYFDFDSKLSGQISGTICVGIGYDLAKGEVGATGTLAFSVNIKKNWNVNKDLEIKASLTPYALLKVGFFTIKTNYDGWNADLWPSQKEKGISIQATEDAAYYISDRNYLTSTTRESVPYVSTGRETKGIESLNIDSVYPEGEPQICTLADGMRVAVWIADDGSKASADRTTLYYAVIKDEVITYSGAVCETGRGDYSPKLLAKGDSVYLAWMNADKQYGDSTTLEEFCSNMSLYLAAFNGTDFGEPVKVTEEGNHLPMMVSLCSDGNGVTVTWVENSEDNAFLASGMNTVYSRHYESEESEQCKVLADQLPYLYGLDSEYVNGEYCAVWSQDTDGDLVTSEDADIYLYQKDAVRQLTDNSVEDTNVGFLGDDLYWSSGGTIRRMPKLDAKRSESLGILCGSEFHVIQGIAGKAIVWMESDGFVTQPMIAYEKGGFFTNPVPLGSFDQVNISGYSVIYEADGSVSMLYDVKEVYDKWTDNPYGQTNMRYTGGLEASNLLVDDYLYYDVMLTAVGETLSFCTDVTNHTGSQIDRLHLVLRNGDKVLKEEERQIELSVGCTETIEIEYVLPQDFARGVYTLTITGVGVEENDLSDNQAATQVGYGNIMLRDCDIAINEDGTAVVTGKVVNNGYQAVSDKTLYIRAGGQVDEVIGQIDGISLAAGESTAFNFTIDKEYAAFTYVYDVSYFYLSVEGKEMETDYSDNTELLLLRPVFVESVDLETDFQMDIGTSRALNVSIVPQNAYAGCIYTSSDLSVASVNKEGVITAYGIGQTDISVITEDGQAVDTCTVTVTTDGEIADNVEYYMSEDELSLLTGDETVLYVYAEAEEDVAIEAVNLTWQSSDDSVVSVTEESAMAGENFGEEYVAAAGRIKALKEGSAVVTGISEGGIAIFCIVTVNNQGIKAVALEKTLYEMQRGETIQLSWVSSPEGAGAADFVFTSSDETIATVNTDGQVTALAQGSARIEMIYTGVEERQEARAVCLIEVIDPELTVYNVRFDTNGGSSLADYIAFQTGEVGHDFIFPETPIRPGYFFAEWNDKRDGTGTSYSVGSTLKAGPDVMESLTLYAIWIPLRDGMWAADIPDQVYTGGKLLPKVTVYDGTRILSEGTDYTLAYKNNIKVAMAEDSKKAPAVIVKGKGNYAGSQTVNFNILPRNIGSSEGIEATDILRKTNGKLQKPIPVVSWNGKRLTNKKDFSVEYPDLAEDIRAYKVPGTYNVVIKGIGGYNGERTVHLTITDNDLISKASVKGIKNQAYTGQAIEQQVVVKYGKQELMEGVDYTVSYENNIEIGTATLIITGIGSYSGVKKVAFKITGGNIKKAKVTGIPKSMVYTGTDLTTAASSWGEAPELIVTVNKVEKILKEGTDYTMSYQKNNNVGTASILFTGINGYSGTLKKNFKIVPYNIDLDSDERMEMQIENSGQIPYMKGGSKPKPIVKYAGQILTEGKDYTLGYRNNTKISSNVDQSKQPTVIIKGKGNFKGTISLSYTIVQQNLGILSMTVPDKVYQNKKNVYKSTPKIVDINGTVLKSGRDYEKNFIYTYKDDVQLADGSIHHAGEPVDKNDILPAGTVVEITLVGKGNYYGQLKDEYHIVQADIGKARVKVPAQIYTGEEIEPDKHDITVELGKAILQDGDYEIVRYSNNVKKGKASITIKGKGNYGGTKTVKFTIKARSVLWWWMK